MAKDSAFVKRYAEVHFNVVYGDHCALVTTLQFTYTFILPGFFRPGICLPPGRTRCRSPPPPI